MRSLIARIASTSPFHTRGTRFGRGRQRSRRLPSCTVSSMPSGYTATSPDVQSESVALEAAWSVTVSGPGTSRSAVNGVLVEQRISGVIRIFLPFFLLCLRSLVEQSAFASSQMIVLPQQRDFCLPATFRVRPIFIAIPSRFDVRHRLVFATSRTGSMQ